MELNKEKLAINFRIKWYTTVCIKLYKECSCLESPFQKLYLPIKINLRRAIHQNKRNRKQDRKKKKGCFSLMNNSAILFASKRRAQKQATVLRHSCFRSQILTYLEMRFCHTRFFRFWFGLLLRFWFCIFACTQILHGGCSMFENAVTATIHRIRLSHIETSRTNALGHTRSINYLKIEVEQVQK